MREDNREPYLNEIMNISPQEINFLLNYRALSDENKLTMDILCKRLLEHEKRGEKGD